MRVATWTALLLAVGMLILAAPASAQWVKGFKAPHYTAGTLKVQ